MDPFYDLLDSSRREGSDPLHKIVLVDGKELRNHSDAGLRQVGFAYVQKNVSPGLRSLEIRGQGADDDRTDPALVEEIVLHDNMGVQEAGS